MFTMENYTSFDKLVMGISNDERVNLLKKLESNSDFKAELDVLFLKFYICKSSIISCIVPVVIKHMNGFSEEVINS